MPKPNSLKLAISLAVLALIAASVVAFGYLWPARPTLKLAGEVQAREIRNGSRFGGRVLKVLVREGQPVQPGQLLIQFDETDLQAKIADAKATLSQAMAQERLLAKGPDAGQRKQASATVQQAQQRVNIANSGARPEELAQIQSKVQAAEAQAREASQAAENAKVMLDEGIISRQKFDGLQDTASTAQSNLTAARAALKMAQSGARPEERKAVTAQLSAARAQYSQVVQGAKPEEVSIAAANVEKARSALQALEAQLNEVRIRAPFPGYVSVVAVTEGELVAPGRPVITVLDYGHLWADVYVPESKLSMVTLGEAVTVKARSYHDAEFAGRVSLINPKSEFIPNSGGDSSSEESTFRVKVAVDNKDKTGAVSLYPGMKIDVFLHR